MLDEESDMHKFHVPDFDNQRKSFLALNYPQVRLDDGLVAIYLGHDQGGYFPIQMINSERRYSCSW